ncbi:MAG: SUF system Fe-S cluster assembly protein [Chromatiaceae bacterium]|nr:SUF system Fe-S cluster assembly protein [Chromatiaceae bacterium]
MNRLARFTGFGHHESEPGTHPTERHIHAQVERMEAEELREPIIAALRTVHDPEIPVNIYDLGLIYRIGIQGNGDVEIDMTLTAPACPVAGMMPVMVREALEKVDGVGNVKVELVWDPPWTQEKMTDEARLQLGLF